MDIKDFLEKASQKKVIALSTSALIIAAGWQLYNVMTAKPQSTKVIPLVRTITVCEMPILLALTTILEVNALLP